MKTEDLKNLSLEEIVKELQTQNLQKHDFVVPAKFMKMEQSRLLVVNEDSLDELSKVLIETGISLPDAENETADFQVLDSCHAQISNRLSIPKRYYDRMLNQEKSWSLLDHNVTHYLRAEGNKNYLLRTFIDKEKKSGIARAILSDRYNILDNYDVMLATLDAIRATGMNIQIESGDITDHKFFMRFICPDIELNAPELLKNYRVPNGSESNNGVISGFVISNSETGNGKFSISPRAVVLACRNGMIFKNDAFEKTHLGAKMEEYSTIDWSEETREKNYELVISQVRDAIKTYASKDYLGAKIHELISKGDVELSNPFETVKNVARHLQISEEREKSILNYFIKGGDTKAFGITQALTYYAQYDATPEERFDIENQAVDILTNIKQFDKPELKVNPIQNNVGLN
jgi:hypothetical protein